MRFLTMSFPPISYFKLSFVSAIILFSTFSYSETRDVAEELSTNADIGFISDEFYVPLRSSPCSTCKIVHKGLKSGTKLFVYEHEEDWSLVATDSGYRGWIRRQHLTENKIARAILAENSNEIERLQSENRRLELDMQNSFELVESLRAQISNIQGDRIKLSKELTDIKLVSSKEIALNEQNQLLVKHNHMLQEERDVLNANVDDLQNNTGNQSLLYGGFLVFLGAILTAIVPRVRGRKRLSEWH
ncbi:MAG: TIGR04211 family SH3 domain-containing protein [Porticoccaceae bacterium]|nr:TIGR04211 family SH3 domain-containing protein [Porticoccaceae bacterium]